MPSNVVKYRIFIASPGGLDDIRRMFYETLQAYNRDEAIPRNLLFDPIGWAATSPGVGRPQELINRDIRTCDRAVFIFRDRWGSRTGKENKYTSGCDEEWELCNQLVAGGEMKSLQLYFLPVPSSQLKDPGAQLKKVLAFRKRIEKNRQHLWRYRVIDT